MAPLTNEPDAVRVVLNLARRKVFYNLILEIVAYMRSQIQVPDHSPESSSQPSPRSNSAGDAPLFIPRSSSSGNLLDDDGNPPSLPLRPRAAAPPSPALVNLRKAALLHFDSWRDETLSKLREVLAKADDQKVVDARRKRTEQLSAKSREVASDGEDLLSFGGEPASSRGPLLPPSTLADFQNLYHPIPTRLTTIPMEDRKEVLSATLILLLSIGNYSAYSRTLICYLSSALEIPPHFLNTEETEIATTMVEAAQKADAERQSGAMSAEAEAQKRREQGQASRLWKVGLASVAGAAIIGVTGGLAAPAVAGVIGGLMGSVGLGGLASFLGMFWMNGALVGTLFGAFGAKMTGEMVDQYAKEVEDFKFLPLREEWGSGWSKTGKGKSNDKESSAEARRLRVTIGINGWLVSEEDVTKPWRVLGDETEVFALRYEMKSLMALGDQLKDMAASAMWVAVRSEILRRTVLATLKGALWPIFLLSSASSVDNPFSLARNRSEKAGRILADALINRVQGERPVTLVGYSLGARVIYACLRVLADRKAFGLVDTVVLIGAPVPSNAVHWQMMRTVVAGKLFNVYSENDYILGFVYRTTSMQLGIAGLQPIGGDIEGVENLDLSNEVTGHLRYPELTAKILARCGFPDVRGGGGAIEKDEGRIEIELRDQDWAQNGLLIDVDEQAKPPRYEPGETPNDKFLPDVKNVWELKSDASVREAKLRATKSESEGPPVRPPRPEQNLGHAGIRDGLGARSITAPATTSARIPVAAGAAAAAGTLIGVSSSSTGGANRLPSPPPPYSIAHDRNDDDYDDDSDEDGGGIRMMDNESDGELTFIEPLRIED
ncbi:DUF726-domain-containing protein [Durotheca rogersii]|uniref:DUF726-domain-containing protein n=1 Tax=Durotheca rogersii TaxID=419775 RepID=UPI00221FDAC5|nr:DUF726-domain-containing protein [Durotheca rogersii]KAI5864867.1 DUF726-domain-containing protein [Durotheca rogersii]